MQNKLVIIIIVISLTPIFRLGTKQAPEKTLLFIGEKRSGKTSLILRYLEMGGQRHTKTTTALDYSFGIKKRNDDDHQKVNVYELGGGRVLTNMLQAPLNEHNLPYTTICIVIDLS